jgi:hypothetical protein
MPHQCTSCGRTFPDGSKEMLSGCPDCGGNKFQFKPAGATEDATPDAGDAPAPSGDDAGSGGAADPPSSAADPSAPDDPSTPADPTDPSPSDPASDAPSIDSAASEAAATPDSPPETDDGTEQIADRNDEDTAQASARSEVVSPDELDRASRDVDPGETAGQPGDEGPQPGIDALRDELNDQFESIRIVSPGQYELNLMELYDRQEYIISLQEDGRYVIEMPDAWGIQDE